MKKHLLLDFTKSLSRRSSFRMAAIAALTLLTAQSTFAQSVTWTGGVGGTNSDFLTETNWSATPLFNSTSNFTIVTGPASMPVLNSNYTGSSGVVHVNTGATLTTNANITTSTSTNNINGTINVNAGSIYSSRIYMGTVANGNGVINVATGGTLNTLTGVWRIGNYNTIAGQEGVGTINVNGGTFNIGTGGAGTFSLGHLSGTTGILNIYSGTVNVNYTSFSSQFLIPFNGHINIDAGTMVITNAADQTAAVQAFIDAGKITAAAGKSLSIAFDGTSKTTVSTTFLGVNDVKQDANSIVVYAQNQNIKIQSVNGTLSDVKVYDLNGRLVAGKKSIGANETSIPLDDSNGVYVVKVTTADGAVVTKKIVQ